MRIGVTLSPTGDWPGILGAARQADERGLDAVGFWDHYHSERPAWAYVCGWSAYGALAAATRRIHLVPMVICQLNYPLGVLAKETAILAIASSGRFELGIGAGDYPAEYAAWHQPYPDAATRMAMLAEKVAALRRLWHGELVTVAGGHVRLTDAGCTPAPPAPPRVVIGVGASRRLIRQAVAYADELNLYAEPAVVAYAREQIAASGRPVALSLFVGWEWEKWPADVTAALAAWQQPDIERVFVSMAGPNMGERVAALAVAQTTLG